MLFARLAMENDFVPRRFVHCHSRGIPAAFTDRNFTTVQSAVWMHIL